MPIYNSNSLQTKEDFNKLSSYSDSFLLEALANLGQRMGVKGDNVIYTHFTCKDLFYNHLLSQTNIVDDNGYIALFYKNNLAHAYYISANKLKESNHGYYKQTDNLDNKLIKIENEIISDAQKTMTFENNTFLYNINLFDNKEIVLNNIESYLSPSRMYLEGDYMYIELFGKLIGTSIHDENNIEYQYNIFNIKSNTLEKNIRIFYLYTDNNIKYYCYIKCEKHSNLDNKYTLDIKFISESDIQNSNEIITSSINRFFTYSNIETDYDLSLQSPEKDLFYSQYRELIEVIDSKGINPIFTTSTYNEFLQYNSNENVLFSFDIDLSDTFNKLDNVLTYQNYSVDTYLRYLSNDITYLYPNLLKIFSQTVFTENKSQFILKILYSIYETCLSYNNSIDQNDYIDKYPVLYIPINYKFYYFCNSNNPLEIYFSNKFNIQYVNLDELNKVDIQQYIFKYDSSNTSQKQLVCDYKGENIIKEYNFNVEYNTKYTDIITRVSIFNTFTYPYINAINTWTINDVETNVIAKYTDSTTKLAIFFYNVTNDASDISNFEFINISESLFNIDTEIQKSVYFYKDIEGNICDLYVPKSISVNSGYQQEASQLILVGCQNYISSNDEIKNNIVYFLYTYNKSSNSFNIIIDSKGYVFLLNNLLNINQLTEYIQQSLHNYEIYKNIVFEIDNTKDLPLKDEDSKESLYHLTYKEKYKLPLNNEEYIYKDKADISETDTFNTLQNDYLITHNFSNIKSSTTKHLLDAIKQQKYINIGSSKWISSDKDNYYKLDSIGIAGYEITTNKYTESNNKIKQNSFSTSTNSLLTTNILNTIRSKKDDAVKIQISETKEEIYKEAIPLNVILTNLEDLLLKDAKFINRLNIIGSDKDKYLYNTSLSLRLFDLKNSTALFYPELLLTSNTHNFIGGHRNLFDNKDGKFKEVDALRLDFNNIYIDSIEWKSLGKNKYITDYSVVFDKEDFGEYPYDLNTESETELYQYSDKNENYTIRYTTVDVERQFILTSSKKYKSATDKNTDTEITEDTLKIPLYYLTYYKITKNNNKNVYECYWKNIPQGLYDKVNKYMIKLDFKYVLNFNSYIEYIINYLNITDLTQIKSINIKYKDNIYKFKSKVSDSNNDKFYFELVPSDLFNYNHITKQAKPLVEGEEVEYYTIEEYINELIRLYNNNGDGQYDDTISQYKETIEEELQNLDKTQHLIFNRFASTQHKLVYNKLRDKDGTNYNFSPLLLIHPDEDLIYNDISLQDSTFMKFRNEDIKIYKDMSKDKANNTNPYFNIIVNL